MDTDIDQRFTVKDGFANNKSFYFYAAKKEAFAALSNMNQGYGQWVHRNMMPTTQTYSLRSLDDSGQQVEVGGRAYDRTHVESGIPLTFNPHSTRHIVVRLASSGAR